MDILGEGGAIMKKLSAITLIILLITFPFSIHNSVQAVSRGNENQTNKEIKPEQIDIILEREYIDGEISQERVRETIWSFEDLWAKYDEWQLMDMKKGEMVFRQQVNDISPLLKANGYFGITEDGVLTIFNGEPRKAQIIQSFFSIDLGKLESKKCEQLKQGIPIKSKNDYMEVLKSFSGYSL